MLQRVVLSFFMIITCLHSYEHNGDNIKQTKQIRYKNDTMTLLQKCVTEDTKSCQILLDRGIPSLQTCSPSDCRLAGALLSFANKDTQALAYLKRSCDNDSPNGCTHLALLYENMSDYKNAIIYYNQACKHSDFLACYNLALLYADSKTPHANIQTAMTLFKRSCHMAYAKACYNLAVLQANEIKDFPVARFYFDRACDFGMYKGCTQATYLKQLNISMPPIEKRHELIQ